MKAILFALVCIAVCQAQTPAQVTVTLEGQVRSITGEPLKNVSVQLIQQRLSERIRASEMYSVVTGASGRFVFDALAAGRYSISASRTGYNADRRSFTIDPSQPPASVSIQLTPFGRIEGKVTDEDGEAYRGQIFGEGLGPTEISADGTFVIEVAPGRYYIQAMPDPYPGGVDGERRGTWPREIDAATYYPSATTTSGATKINVPAGAIVRGIDIRIRRVAAYTIRGHAIDASTGKPVANIQIQLTATDRNPLPWEMTAATTLADGSFEFKDVQPGTYSATTVRSRIADGIVPPPLYSLQPVVVGKENVEDLELALQRGAEIRGKIIMESGDPVKPAAPSRVTLRGGNGNRGGSGQVQNDGSFVLSDLEPEKYVLQIFGQPPQTYVKSVWLNQQETTDLHVDLSSGTGGIMEVVLSPHVAEVGGIIRDASGAPAAEVVVSIWRPGRITGGTLVPPSGTERTDANGAFRIGNLGPGEYRIAAWANSPAGVLLTPEFLSQFDGRAAVVRLEDDARVNVDAPLISKEAIDQAQEYGQQ